MPIPESSLRVQFRRLQDRWRDPLLSALTVLLVILIFLIAPLHAANIIHSQDYGIAVVLVVAGGVLVMSGSVIAVVAMLVAIALAIAAAAVPVHEGSQLDVLLETIAWVTLSLALLWVVARTVFAPGPITNHRVIGAILLYVTIGLVFVGLFATTGLLIPAAFSGMKVTDDPGLASQLIYFSFVTLTSVGYGDIVAVHPLARSLCNVEAIIGQLYPATLLAWLVTLHLDYRRHQNG